MPEMKTENKIKQPNGNRKPLVAAVCVVLALAVILVAFLGAKGPIFCMAAEKKAEKGEFSEAIEAVAQSNGEKAEILEKYITLRLDIVESYPALLTEFDFEKISSWKESADFIAEKSDLR